MKHVGLVLGVSLILSAPAAAQDDLARWRYWKTIKVDTTASGAKVKGDVKNFPVPVLLDSSNFDFTQAKKDGGDLRFSKTAKFVADEFVELESKLVDKYLCNFSVFQSLPDHWALDQLFPVIPIHRLNESPTRRATLVDITCDSDGEV